MKTALGYFPTRPHPELVCLPDGRTKPEQEARFKAESAAALEARDTGRITWKQWAISANDAFRSYLGPQSLDVEAFLAKRVYIGSEVDAKRLTVEGAQALLAQEAANAQRQRQQDALSRRAVERRKMPLMLPKLQAVPDHALGLETQFSASRLR